MEFIVEKRKDLRFIGPEYTGVLKGDEETLIHVVHTYEVPGLVADGTISGGMIPKMECCVDAIAGGVERVHILDGRIPHSILIELLSDQGIGTMLQKED